MKATMVSSCATELAVQLTFSSVTQSCYCLLIEIVSSVDPFNLNKCNRTEHCLPVDD